MQTKQVRFISGALVGVLLIGIVSVSRIMPVPAQGRGGGGRKLSPGPVVSLSQILGRPTNQSITISVLSQSDVQVYAEFGPTAGHYVRKTAPLIARAGVPVEIDITGLKPDAGYFYRLQTRTPDKGNYVPGAECSFHTQRAPGSTFTFDLQGDSHPEREGKMYDPTLYAETMRSAAKDSPDFYITLGDDFSIERLIEQNTLNQADVDSVYAHQRSFLGVVGSSAALFLVNGNHEQAARHWLDGTPNNPGVMAGVARTRYYPLPAPDSFYSGDTEKVKNIGLLRDYYAWTWGDALFVAIDPYWHSPVGVDDGRAGSMADYRASQSAQANGSDPANPTNPTRQGGGRRGQNPLPDEQTPATGGGNGGANSAGNGNQNPGGRQGGRKRGGQGGGKDGGQGGGQGGGKGRRDLWQITLGDDQYKWLAKTLKESKAKYKFVFAHHVMGTGRGGIEEASLYEWGGKDRRGVDMFKEKRPGWEMPIHELFVKTGVTIFFQGHDHIYAKQDLDGVVYQSTPNPADETSTAFNREAYQSGTVLPNAGHLRVRVAREGVKVDYVRSFLKADETATLKNGMVANSYTVTSRSGGKSGVTGSTTGKVEP